MMFTFNMRCVFLKNSLSEVNLKCVCFLIVTIYNEDILKNLYCWQNYIDPPPPRPPLISSYNDDIMHFIELYF